MNYKVEKERLHALRELMASEGIACCIISDTDPHHSEVPPAHWRGREWLTGFKSENGTSGTAVVTATEAYVWTDNRYFIQARTQLEGTGFEMMPTDGPEAIDMIGKISEMINSGDTVGIDGMTFSIAEAQHMEQEFNRLGIKLRTDIDIFKKIWSDRPERPANPLFVHDEKITGEAVDSKIRRIIEETKKEGANAILMCSLDDIAWATNLRAGNDIAFSPVFPAYLYLDADGNRILFVDPKKIDSKTADHIKSYNIKSLQYDEVTEFVATLSNETRLLIDPATTARGIYDHIGCTVVSGGDGVKKLKSIKNSIQLANWRIAMEKDGVALTRLFKWIEEEYPKGELSEMKIARKLRELRLADSDCVDESFAAIVGWNDHGAIVHYEPTDETDAPVRGKGILLIDSGGQYIHGTTDITRTIALGGTPTEEQRHDFTLVLKGHIALARAKFPKGTRGTQLDILARQYLWNEGKAYYHGTGHGVGFFINCHEGPQQIRMNDIPVALEPGMVVSNEPGFYREGHYGIRSENILAIEACESNEYGDFYQFSNLTLFPYDMTLTDFDMLTPEETEWIKEYHEEVKTRLSPLLEEDEQEWLYSKLAIQN